MSGRRKRHGEGNHERWLISYADFITLLFAFFVVMFASSQADHNKARQVAESVERAFDGARKGRGGKSVSQSGEPRETPPLQQTARLLEQQLREEIHSGKMSLALEQRGLVISLSQSSFFPSGEDTIDPSMFPSLQKVATAIRPLPNPIRLEGHTDSVPIHTERFRSNWDLSAARAIAVLEIFRDRWKIPPGRLAITGYGDTIPIDANETEEGRARNRRVDLVVLSDSATLREPAAKGLKRNP